MAENDDVNTLKRRGRRRLVGAIALVLVAVIVLPMVFEPEQKGSAPPVSVRIPGEDESGFTPKVTAKSPPLQEQKAAERAVPKAVEPPAESVHGVSAKGELPQVVSRGGRFGWTVSLDVPALDCAVISGWRREEVR